MGRKLLSLALGFAIGAVLISILVLVFAPSTGKELRGQVKDHYKGALKTANAAAEKRREELEAELAQMRGTAS